MILKMRFTILNIKCFASHNASDGTLEFAAGQRQTVSNEEHGSTQASLLQAQARPSGLIWRAITIEMYTRPSDRPSVNRACEFKAPRRRYPISLFSPPTKAFFAKR